MKKHIFFFSLIFLSLNVFALDGTWRKGSDDIYSAFRSNAPHFWDWLSQQNVPVLKAEGVVVGDPHILNFGDVQLKNGGREYSLVDMDDGGNGSFVGDFVRFAVGNQISPYVASMDDLIKSYIYGLNGTVANKPAVLVDAESRSDNDFYDRQAKYLKKMTDKNKFSDKAGLSDLHSAPSDILELYQNSKNQFFAEIGDYTVYDIGYKVKEGGGSQGLVRFWFLVGKQDSKYIIEFKLETDPSVSLFNSNQESAVPRFSHLASIYRPNQQVYGPYKFIDTGSAVFLMRARISPFLDFDPSKIQGDSDIQDGKVMSLYIANKMGLWQRSQGFSSQELNASGVDQIKTLIINYKNLITTLNQ